VPKINLRKNQLSNQTNRIILKIMFLVSGIAKNFQIRFSNLRGRHGLEVKDTWLITKIKVCRFNPEPCQEFFNPILQTNNQGTLSQGNRPGVIEIGRNKFRNDRGRRSWKVIARQLTENWDLRSWVQPPGHCIIVSSNFSKWPPVCFKTPNLFQTKKLEKKQVNDFRNNKCSITQA